VSNGIIGPDKQDEEVPTADVRCFILMKSFDYFFFDRDSNNVWNGSEKSHRKPRKSHVHYVLVPHMYVNKK
jgi:hypothetical protein